MLMDNHLITPECGVLDIFSQHLIKHIDESHGYYSNRRIARVFKDGRKRIGLDNVHGGNWLLPYQSFNQSICLSQYQL